MTKNTILLSVLLLMLPFFSEANDNHISFKSLVDDTKNYLDNPCSKKEYYNKMDTVGLKGKGYDTYEIADTNKTEFYRILAMLSYEKPDWFSEESPLEFTKKGLRSAANQIDRVACYQDIILAHLDAIRNEFVVKQKEELKDSLDNYFEEIMELKSDSIRIHELKHKAQHNRGIIERILGNYDGAEAYLKPIANLDSVKFTDSIYYKLELATNTISELGRVYLSKGIYENKDKYIREAKEQFDLAIAMLDTCSPPHLKELYQRKQKALRFLGENNEANKLNSLIDNFRLNSCYKYQRTITPYLLNRMNSDLKLLEFEAIELNHLVSHQIKKQDDLVKSIITLCIISGLLLLGIIVRNNRKLKHKNDELESNNKLLKDKNDGKFKLISAALN